MSDTVEEIFYNISTWKEVLQFPDLASIGEDEISPPALDLMKRLICDPEVRLGKTAGAEDIKSHAFFDNFDWRHIRSLTPPFVPKVRNTPRHDQRHDTRRMRTHYSGRAVAKRVGHHLFQCGQYGQHGYRHRPARRNGTQVAGHHHPAWWSRWWHRHGLPESGSEPSSPTARPARRSLEKVPTCN